MKEYCIFTFESVGESITFDKKVKALGYKSKLIPAPREVSASCGTAARVDCDKEEELKEIARKEDIHYNGFFKIEKK
ncbi:MAG: DUF3343 domain-containing protein [Tissierellia bacterium]|nr:DUF3343 domain-containing protein [Tissierellia bacterium]